MESILPNEMHGVMYESGLRGVGKSFLAAQADRPENICYLDFEDKGTGIDAMLHFGMYRGITSETAKLFGATYRHVNLYEVFKKIFEEIEPNKYTVCVLDNIAPFEQALGAEVKRDPQRYGIDVRRAESGAYGGVNPGVHTLVSGYCNALYGKGIKLIIAISHMGNTWTSGGIVPNKYRAKGVERWQELSILSLVLIPGQFAPIPAAIVQKEQLGLITFNSETGEHEVKRRLPLKLPKATFAEIRRYLKEPADLEHPKSGEVPSEQERDPFTDRFSKDQLEYIKLATRIAAKEIEDSNGNGHLVKASEPITEPGTIAELIQWAGLPMDELLKVSECKDFAELSANVKQAVEKVKAWKSNATPST